MSAQGDVLCPAHIKDLLGLASERAAREWVHREGVPHIQVGRSFVVLRASLLAWLKEHEAAEPGDQALTSAADNLCIDENIDLG